MKLEDLSVEREIREGRGRSQSAIFWNFLKVVLKLRVKTIGFWVYIVLSLAWIYFIRLFSRGPVLEITPYNISALEPSIDIDPKDYFFAMLNNSFGMMPKNAYTQYLAEQFLSYPVNRTINYFKDSSEMNKYFSSKKNGYFSFVFPEDVLNNLKKLSVELRIDNIPGFSANMISGFLMDGTLEYNGHSVAFSSEYADYSETGKKDLFNDGNEANYASLLGLSIICLILRSALQMIELRELKLFLLLTISGAREIVLWLSLFLIDLFFIIPHSLAIAIMINQCKATYQTSLTLVMAYSLINNLAVYFFLVFFISLIPRTSFFKYVSIICFVAAIFIPVSQIFAFKPTTNKLTIRTLSILFPQFCPFLFYQNVEYAKYLNRTLTWDTLSTGLIIETGTVMSFGLYTMLIYVFLFLVCLLMNPRSSGVPPIGWANIFKSQYWKKLFSFSSKQIDSSIVSKDEPLIRIDKITKTYKGTFLTRALNEISFDIKNGEVIVLIGPNGSGKSTLLNSMTGSIEADSGNLYLSGQYIDTGFSELQNHIGITFQDNVFFPTLSVIDHLRFFGRIRGVNGEVLENQIQSLTSSLDFSSSLTSLAGSLSGGQKRKLCISIAFIGNPAIVILDEPTAGIDVSTRQTIWKSLSQYKDTTVIVSSHSLEEAESVSSRIFVMKSGDLVFTGTSSELRRAYNCGYRIAALGKDADIDALLSYVQRTIPEASRDSERKDSVLIQVDDRVVDILEDLVTRLDQFRIESINVTAEALEHVLLRLIADEEK